MSNKITQRVHVYINGKQVEKTLSNISKSLREFKAKANRATPGTKDWKRYNDEVARLETEISAARVAQKEFREESKKTNGLLDESSINLNEFTGNLSTMWQGMRSGDLISVREGFNGVKSGIKGATKSAMAFIATPLGATIAILAGIGVAAKAWFNYNSKVVEALRLTTSMTGLTDRAADKARINAETLQEVYGVEFEKTMSTAHKLVQQFGVSYDEAFSTIEDGLKRGQTKNDEYFDSLSEYGTFFKAAGYSATEFKDIISTGYDLGIYKDKLPDALKEADLALKEQTKATKDSLANAFGTAFSDELLKKVAKGEITTKQALQEIAKESENANLSQQQFAQLTADVFKGAGEDVGGAKKIFEALTVAIDGTKKPLTESQQLLEDQANATRQLKEVTSTIFSSGDKGFGLLVDRGKLFLTEVLVKLLQSGIDVVNWFIDMNNQSGMFSAGLKLISKIAGSTFSAIGIVLKNTIAGFKGLGDIIEGIFTWDTDKITEGFTTAMSTLPNIIKDTVAKAKEDFSEIKNAFQGSVKIERVTLDTYATTETDTSNGLTPKQIKAAANKVALADKTEKEITAILEKERLQRELNAKSGLEKDLAAVDQKYALLIEKAGVNSDLVEQITQERADAKKDIILQKEKELQEELDVLTFEAAEALKLKKFDDLIANAETKKAQELYIIERAHFIADRELEIDQAKELAKLDGVEGAEILKDKIRKKYALKQAASDKGFNKASKTLKSSEVDWAEKTEDQKYGAVKGGLSSAANAFNKNTAAYKAAKIAETVISTRQSAVSSYNSLAGIPVIGPALGVAASAVAIASGLKQVAAIKGTDTGKMPTPFAAGGFTDGLGTGQKDATGEEVANATLHVDEYVVPRLVRKMPGVPAVIQWLEQKRSKKLKGFADGGNEGLSKTLPTVVASDSNNDDGQEENYSNVLLLLKNEIIRLNNLLDSGLSLNYTLNDEIARQKLEDKLNKTILKSKN